MRIYVLLSLFLRRTRSQCLLALATLLWQDLVVAQMPLRSDWSVTETLVHSDRQVAYILDPAQLTLVQKNELKTLQENRIINQIEIDRFWLVGDGIPFEILRQFALEPELLKSPEFNRTLRAASQYQLPVMLKHMPGTVGSYATEPARIYISEFANFTGRVFVHEVQHARFDRFHDRLRNWVVQKGWVLPYEVDGDRAFNMVRAERQDVGGVMTILDEIEAWRKTLSVTDEMSFRYRHQQLEKKVLDIVLQNYGGEVGELAIEEFKKEFSSESFVGKNVAKVILEETRRLNLMSREEVLQMGRNGFAENSRASMMNFINLIEVRQIQLNPAEEELVYKLRFFAGDSLIKKRAQAYFFRENFVVPPQLDGGTTNKRSEGQVWLEWEMQLMIAQESKDMKQIDALLLGALHSGTLLQFSEYQSSDYYKIFRTYKPSELPLLTSELAKMAQSFDGNQNQSILRIFFSPPVGEERSLLKWTFAILKQSDFATFTNRRLLDVVQFFGNTLANTLNLELGIQPEARLLPGTVPDLGMLEIKVQRLSLKQTMVLKEMTDIFVKLLELPTKPLQKKIFLSLEMNPLLWLLVRDHASLNNLPTEELTRLRRFYSGSPAAISCGRSYF